MSGHRGRKPGWECQASHGSALGAGYGSRLQLPCPGWESRRQLISPTSALPVFLLAAVICLAGSLTLLATPAVAQQPAESAASVGLDGTVAGLVGPQGFDTVPVSITAAGFTPRVVTVTTCTPVEWTNLTAVTQRIVAGAVLWRVHLPVIGVAVSQRRPHLPVIAKGGVPLADEGNGRNVGGPTDDERLPGVLSVNWGGLVPASGGKLARTFASLGTYPYHLDASPKPTGTVVVMNLTNFSIEVEPSSQMVGRSGRVSAKYIVRVVDRGSQATRVTLSAADAQGGTSFSWSANPVTPTREVVLTVTAAGGTPLGVHQLTITGTDGCLQRSVTTTLNVVETVATDLYLPVTANDAWPGGGSQWRFGFGVVLERGATQGYDVGMLRAGWYLDWGVSMNPPRLAGLEYVQVVRVRVPPSCSVLRPYVWNNPGSWWFIGSEPDQANNDNAFPDEYARIYHDLYWCIKSVEPQAKVSPGGIVQPTALRLQYLDMVLAAYRNRYGASLPADGWNIHNHAFLERSCEAHPERCWGCQIPPGVPATEGANYGIQDNDSITIFKSHVVAFRQWMKRNGYQNMPLFISEYGITMPAEYGFGTQRVIDYMYATFQYMLGAQDCNLGYAADGCRLVQRWNWWSLNDWMYVAPPQCTGVGCGSNGNLFDSLTRQITAFGLAYRNRPNY
jgi:hypothetical protein